MPDENPEVKTEPKVESKPSLKSAVADAVKDSPVKLGEVEIKEEIKADEVKDEPKTEEQRQEEFTKEQTDAALNLYRAFANPDPNIQRQALEILAKAANLEIKDIATKQEQKEIKKDLTGLLKEGLGEFDFLADKLGPILDKVLKDYVTENTKDIRERQNLNEREKQEQQVNDAIETVFESYTLTDPERATLVKEMESLMDNFQPGKNTSHQQYFKSLIVLAAENKNINLKSTNTKGMVDKIVKNRNDAGTRLASERGAEVKDVVRTTNFKNIRDAVKDAMEKTTLKK